MKKATPERTTFVLAIDDDSLARETFERLDSRKGFACKAIGPPPSLAELDKIISNLIKDRLDVLVLDYRLDLSSSEDYPRVTYYGATLAAKFKEKFKDFPIVLATTQAFLSDYVQNSTQVGGLFDHTIIKERFAQDMASRDQIVAEIVDLGTGFRRLRELRDEGISDVVPKALVATDEEFKELALELRCFVPQSVPDIAYWLLRELLLYPGPLLDEHEARALLGLTVDSFRNQAVQSWLNSTRYSGIFCQLRPRWWRNRVIDRLRSVGDANPLDLSSERANAIAKGCAGYMPEPDFCCRCQEEGIQRVCNTCHKTVDVKHHLPVYSDSRPIWALPDVVCFECIASRKDGFDDRHYGHATKMLLDKLRREVG